MAYEDLMGDVDDFSAAFEYWMNAYHKRGERIEELEEQVDLLKLELDEARDEIQVLWEQLNSYRAVAGF